MPGAMREGISDVAKLSSRELDRFSAALQAGKSKATAWTHLPNVRLMLSWAAKEGEADIEAKTTPPKLPKPLADVNARRDPTAE
jgi:hypothetical protein